MDVRDNSLNLVSHDSNLSFVMFFIQSSIICCIFYKIAQVLDLNTQMNKTMIKYLIV